MRLDPTTGLAVFASLDTYQGDSSGRVTVLRPGQAREAGWITDSLWAINTPDDPAHPDDRPWHAQNAIGQYLLGPWPYLRVGGGVAAGSNNECGQCRWADGLVQDFTGRILGVDASGVALITDRDHRTITLYAMGIEIGRVDCGGIIQQSDQGEPDQLDCQRVNGWLTFRTEHGTTMLDRDLQPVAD
ncbi:MAG TPA: hypothetical protein VNM37_04680, partial [Candidatus Dormibacteraeota bacterium]|nr:hypothetical protein [Candidatus Dormibacteraeota bacterium]